MAKGKKADSSSRVGKGDLIRHLSSAEMEKESGLRLSYAESTLVIDAVFNSIKTLLKDHGKVNIPGFGTFVITKTAARTARNPQNGQPVQVPEKYRPKFRASVKLSNEFNN